MAERADILTRLQRAHDMGVSAPGRQTTYGEAADEILRLRGVLRRHFVNASRCQMETRSHGLLCECFAPKSDAEKLAIEVAYYGFPEQARSSSAKGDES